MTAPRTQKDLAKRQHDYVTAKQCAEIVNYAVREALLAYHVSQESRRWSVRAKVALVSVWRWFGGVLDRLAEYDV